MYSDHMVLPVTRNSFSTFRIYCFVSLPELKVVLRDCFGICMDNVVENRVKNR